MKKTLFLTLALLLTAGFIFGQSQKREGESKSDMNWSPSRATISVTPIDGSTVTAGDLVETIVGTGISYSNVSYTGTIGAAIGSAGLFTNGNDAGIGIDEGILLGSGYALNARGPNSTDGSTDVLGTGGDADLTTLAGFTTNDATVLEFDFVPDGDTVFITFVFSSEEYNEFVNSTFNDVFAFYVNGTNIALVPGSALPVTINNVNNGNPFGSLPNSFPQFYINNDLDDGGPFFDIEPDGFTTVFTDFAVVNSGVTNTMKIAIADASDDQLDSWVFIKAESFSPDPDDPDIPLSPWSLLIGAVLIAGAIWFRMTRISRA